MDSENEKKLKERRDVARKKIYSLAFEIFIIFGGPAFLAYFLGRYFINSFELDKSVFLFFLLPSFIFSWIIFFIKFRKISKEISDLNQKINSK